MAVRWEMRKDKRRTERWREGMKEKGEMRREEKLGIRGGGDYLIGKSENNLTVIIFVGYFLMLIYSCYGHFSDSQLSQDIQFLRWIGYIPGVEQYLIGKLEGERVQVRNEKVLMKDIERVRDDHRRERKRRGGERAEREREREREIVGG